ncbi:flagellar biosynthesis protein FlhF [Lysobacter sp. GX 14042]|uniref:flagellar biosynthesis protein FlhF n=1 Tax=Lysobacter sp. GX 14042 TaxID=2907155 RepID=UPI001F432771|nr:flagellar biosynthesis protein FlhF [Lysobacter sp. GX 14042]MCE7033341.1 flagellar biosynthesis protein FlhF [Lysobacter sp. GX 14042]
MRIKRFIAPDMRTALRMVREDQGADAVILSNRPVAQGIEVVAATDYDEVLVQQALRTAATPRAAAAQPDAEAKAASETPSAADAAPAPAPSVRDTLATRARAVFRLGEARARSAEEPTLADLTQEPAAPVARVAAAPDAQAPSSSMEAAPQATAPASPAPSRFEAMMSALADPDAADHLIAAANGATTSAASTVTADSAHPPATESREPARPTPTLRAVPDPAPEMVALRTELSDMRKLIEQQVGQLALERLRGSPARATAYDLLVGYGCDESLAQQVASRLDPALDPERIHPPMLAELARTLTVIRSEPIDDGGVIALVGPTGAGKTTTVAKLAARFAARHRARDVAMVTTDIERIGAREQLHAHGRRLGITVCEADGPEALAGTLEQLQDYPLVLVDTAGYGPRDRALLGQVTWLRATGNLRSLLVLPANAHPHDMNEVVRRYRMAAPEGVVLTKTDETGRLGAAVSMLVRNGLGLAYTTCGQRVPGDLEAASASGLVLQLEKLRRAADNPLVTEDRHVSA